MVVVNARILKDPCEALEGMVMPFRDILTLLHDGDLAIGTRVRYNEFVYTVRWHEEHNPRYVLQRGSQILWSTSSNHNSSGLQLRRAVVR